jgi:type IV pilus assembly protein PilV
MLRVSAAPPKRSAGVFLVEALVALVVLALFVLGQLLVQVRQQAGHQAATHRVVAGRLARDLLEGIQAHPTPLSVLHCYATDGLSEAQAFSEVAPCQASRCTSTEWARREQAAWLGRVSRELPAGRAAVEVDRIAGRVEVMLAWRATRALTEIDPTKTGANGADLPAGMACPVAHSCHHTWGTF